MQQGTRYAACEVAPARHYGTKSYINLYVMPVVSSQVFTEEASFIPERFYRVSEVFSFLIPALKMCLTEQVHIAGGYNSFGATN